MKGGSHTYPNNIFRLNSNKLTIEDISNPHDFLYLHDKGSRNATHLSNNGERNP